MRNQKLAIFIFTTFLLLKVSFAYKDYSDSYFKYDEYQLKSSADRYFKQEYYTLAIMKYEELIQINPQKVEYNTKLGISYVMDHQEEQGLTYLKKAVDIEPKNKDDNYYIGLAYIQMKQYKNAIKSLEKCIEEDPKNFEYLKNLGQANEELGELKEAIKWYEKSSEQNPYDYQVEQKLKYLKNSKTLTNMQIFQFAILGLIASFFIGKFAVKKYQESKYLTGRSIRI